MPRHHERASFVQMRILENINRPHRQIATFQDLIMRSNVRFVATIVLSYDRRGSRLAVDDLMSEGMVGLMEAMSRFDPSRNCKFITYAVWWIRNTIISALIQAYTITPSQSFIDKIRKMEKEKKKLEQSLGRYLTPAESFDVSDMRGDFKDAYVAHTTPMASLESTIFADSGDHYENKTLREAIPDKTLTLTDDAMVESDLTKDVQAAVDSIDNLRERFIVKSYHGIEGPPMVLEEIGRSLGLTRERVRQIYWLALRRMSRNPTLRAHRKDSY